MKPLSYPELCNAWFSTVDRGDLNSAKIFIANHPEISVEIVKDHNQTALLRAASKGHSRLTRWLLEEKQANPFVVDTQGNTFLHHCVKTADQHILDLGLSIVPQGLDVNAVNHMGMTPLILELKTRTRSQRVRSLLDAGADPLLLNNRAIGVACLRDAVPTLPLLREHGADIHQCSYLKIRDQIPLQSTPLHLAAETGSLMCVEWLLKNCVDVNPRDQAGDTPLMKIAACRTSPNTLAVARLLLNKGADGGAQNNEGKRALDFASEAHEPTLYAILKVEAEHAVLTHTTPQSSHMSSQRRL